MAAATNSALNVSTGTTVKATPGTLARVSVITAGAAGAVYDVADVADVAAGNKIGVIPAVIGIYYFDWPCLAGIAYVPGSAQVASISFD